MIHRGRETLLEQALYEDIDVLLARPTGSIRDLPLPSTTQGKVYRSLFRMEFERFQDVELVSLLGVGCFRVMDEKDAPKRAECYQITMDAHFQKA